MKISLYGLLFAALFLALGLAQWAFLKKMLARGLEAERTKIPAEEFATRQTQHAIILKAVFRFDLLVLAPAGYYVGYLIFGN